MDWFECKWRYWSLCWLRWKPRVEGASVKLATRVYLCFLLYLLCLFSSVFAVFVFICISGAGRWGAREPDFEGGRVKLAPAFVASLTASTGKHLAEHSQVQSSYLHLSLSLSVFVFEVVFVLKVEFAFVMYLCLNFSASKHLTAHRQVLLLSNHLQSQLRIVHVQSIYAICNIYAIHRLNWS